MKEALKECVGFEWDSGNSLKNWIKHKVQQSECEEVFFNEPLIMAEDTEHSLKERRYFVLGKTDLGRRLFIVFTIRNKKIRIISARDMSKREKRCYEKESNTIVSI